jgi:hypothetical protein
MVNSARRVDDDWDDDLYDRSYYPKKVFKDGKGPRVPMMLTDSGLPPWLETPRRPLFDANTRRPHFAVVDRADPHVRAAEAAYEARNAFLRDAWRGPSNRPPPALKNGQSPRDQYIARLTNAWKTPPGSVSGPDDDDDDPNPIEAQRRRWLSPGATPGSDAATVTKDAAVADRDQAYGEYLDRISNAWRR